MDKIAQNPSLYFYHNIGILKLNSDYIIIFYGRTIFLNTHY
jgi:hypothetical protein